MDTNLKEVMKYRQEHIAQNQSRLCKEKEEYEVYLKELEKHRAKVEAERQAMLKEYAEYLKNDACGDTVSYRVIIFHYLM
ncbi:unnamed protein product [Trichobilharzia regenti]|nr:unnamed protein product [Trichobilharzia regenti]